MKESQMVTKWLWEKHRTSLQWRRQRLGVLPDKAMNRMYMTLLRWADAIFIEKGIVHIVEAKLRPDLGAIGQLEGYRELFRNTPEFQQYWDHPIKLIFLCPIFDTTMAEMCSKKGIEYVIYELFSE